MSTSVNGLNTYFTSLVSSLMAIERQPLTRLTTQRQSVSVQRGLYLELNTQLRDLQSLCTSLISTDPFSVFPAGRRCQVVNAPSGLTVLSASASMSAVAGQYDVSEISLAVAQRRASAEQASADQALGRSGTFWLGGTGAASLDFTPNATVSGASASAVTAGLSELGTGEYAVEVRLFEGAAQFRLTDPDGRAVAIADQDAGDGSLTSSWQSLAAGSVDTGRGLSLTLSGETGIGSTAVDYTAAGVAVSIETGDSLADIADKLNDARQPEGRDLVATVVGKHLVLTAAQTGTRHTMIYGDLTSDGGLGFADDLQPAADASFRVNGILFSRSTHVNLTDVIGGVSLSLAPDAAGQSASLIVEDDPGAIRSAIESFVARFNSVMAFLEEKTAVTISTSGTTTSYSRGALANESIFSDLRSDLLSQFMALVENGAGPSSLRQIGLTIDDNLRAQIADSSKLETALADDPQAVSGMLDQLMAGFDNLLGRFTGVSTGYLESSAGLMESELVGMDAAIADFNIRLEDRELSLISQFGEMQAQLISLTYMQEQWASIYSSLNAYL